MGDFGAKEEAMEHNTEYTYSIWFKENKVWVGQCDQELDYFYEGDNPIEALRGVIELDENGN